MGNFSLSSSIVCQSIFFERTRGWTKSSTQSPFVIFFFFRVFLSITISCVSYFLLLLIFFPKKYYLNLSFASVLFYCYSKYFSAPSNTIFQYIDFGVLYNRNEAKRDNCAPEQQNHQKTDRYKQLWGFSFKN